MDTKTFTEMFKAIENEVEKTKKSALNKAATKGRNYLVDKAATALGVKKSVVKKRTKVIKATSDALGTTISVGTQFGLPASEFKPKSVKVQSQVGLRLGASIEVKGNRFTLPQAFIVPGKNSGKALVVQRKGKHKYPVETVRVKELEPVVSELTKDVQVYMGEQVQVIFNEDMAKKFSK